jgi:hypothetical protein
MEHFFNYRTRVVSLVLILGTFEIQIPYKTDPLSLHRLWPMVISIMMDDRELLLRTMVVTM